MKKKFKNGYLAGILKSVNSKRKGFELYPEELPEEKIWLANW